MMSRAAPRIALLLVLFICFRGSLGSGSGVGEPKIRCKEAERKTLLRIKQDFSVPEFSDYVPSNVLSSWGEEEEKRECCDWTGIRCSNNSGHVITLDLSSAGLGGEASPELGNLSSLQVLGLRGLNIKSLDWVSRLFSLRVLDLSGNNMSLANDWVHLITNPPRFLTTLLLSGCDLPDTVPSLFNSSEVLEFLDLSGNPFSRSVFPWLFYSNRSLVHLSLHFCENLRGPIPNGFNSMAGLIYLDLSDNELDGIIPESFGNLISLTYLDLNSNQLYGLHPKSFGNMTALTYLDLTGNQLRGSIPQSFGDMTTIRYLSLQSNNLKVPIPEHFGNMSSLDHLDLSNNMLEGEIPKSIWKICTLRRFEAYNNSLSGEIQFAQLNSSMSCANFSLEYLDLNQNKIVGPLPDFTLHPSLIELHLSSNKLTGISNSIGQLSKLEIMDFSKNSIQSVISEAHFAKLFNLKLLDFSENSIQGVISEAHFAKLFNLTYLDLSANSNLALKITSDWIPPFQLELIYLGSCKLGPHFPNWLQTQKNHYRQLNISNSGISDSIPDWLWDFNPTVALLDLSKNGIRGIIHDAKKRFNFSMGFDYPDIDLSSNQLQGPVPGFLFEVTNSLSLFNNSFSQLDSLCNITTEAFSLLPLIYLDISNNQLSGELPDCWFQAENLKVLILANNNLSGKIPVSMGFLFMIDILHLGNNNLTGELPSSLMNHTDLMLFDVGDNKLSGPIPTWIGKNLNIISLRSNHFNGSINSQLCYLMNLQVLDLSFNDLSAEIPKCLGNIIAMKQSVFIDREIPYRPLFDRGSVGGVPPNFVKERLVLIWKGAISEFKNVGFLKNIDLSSNKLIGEIPRDIMTLVQLNSLNLSRNNLSGHIPQEIGQMKSLDALDLSNNNLLGQIPSSLSQVDRLGVLDLSYNNLSGEIPAGTQLRTRDVSAFLGNPHLCGAPLPKKCPNEEQPLIPKGFTKDGHRDELITKGFYISLAIGFVVGFWGLCGTLIFNKSLRYAYLKLLNDMGDWIHVTKEIHKRKLLRWIQS